MRKLLPAILVLPAVLARAHRPDVGAVDVSDRPAGLAPAPPPAPLLPLPLDADAWVADFEAWSARNPTYRLHATLERPLYRPGDTVSAALWSVATRGMVPAGDDVTARILDPRGAQVHAWSAVLDGGTASMAFQLGDDAPGGTYTLRLESARGGRTERSFVVSTFETPRIGKTLTFAGASYGPGEQVHAALTLTRSTGEPLAGAVATARLQVDGVQLEPFDVRTDRTGAAAFTFGLPASLSRPDASLLVVVEDGGVTEAISRPVPVVLDQVRVAWFPEGGDLVEGLPSRVYFEATDAHGQPAHARGVVVDDLGRTAARFESWVDGRGHVSITPERGRTYVARVDRAAGAPATFPLPAAQRWGCTLRHHDDLDGELRALRVSVACTEAREVVVFAFQRERVLDRAAVRVDADRPATVYLRSGDPALDGAPGVARVTVFGEAQEPLAERLVYRNRERGLQVRIAPDKASYAPGDRVVLDVHTADPEGRPVSAVLAVAVVDDALLTHADDDGHNLVSQVQLNAVLPEPVRGVARLFDPDTADAGLGLDLVLGTRGWTRFDWSVLDAPEVEAIEIKASMKAVYTGSTALGQVLTKEFLQRIPAGRTYQSAVQTVSGITPVRQHAEPLPGDDGVRDDFRDAVLWAPTVRTSALGHARLELDLADAVTGFRAVAEGAGGGFVGRGDAAFASVLPFSADLRLPAALSAGDRLLMPVTFTNRGPTASKVAYTVDVTGALARRALPRGGIVEPGGRRTVHVPLVARPGQGTATVSLSASAGGREDRLVREIPVVPRGFPVGWSAAGLLAGRVEHQVRVPEVVPGSLTAELTVLPSPMAAITEGLEAMIRMPGGCFEQTSSTNYPNVLAIDLLGRRGVDLRSERRAVLDEGYRRLAGFQVGSGGFETFGRGPGKEALSAYGLVQFADMAKVYAVQPALLASTVDFLLGQRTGDGGYRVTGASAHGYGNAPTEVLDAYITWALVETGHRDLPREIEASAALARRTDDPYRLALATMTLLAVRPEEGRAAAARLARLQAGDGSFPGSETSITRSENYNLLVEATSLAAMALLEAGDLRAAGAAVEWIHGNRTSAGSWGTTQGNALALKAIAAMSEASASMGGAGRVRVTVEDRVVAEAVVAAGQLEPLVLDLGRLQPGDHRIAVTLDEGRLPYVLELDWFAETPLQSDDRRLDLETLLSHRRLRVGGTTRLTARLTDRTDRVVPDPIARIGLPAGLVAQTWQLEQLKERGEIAFFETRPREVTLYWHGIAPGEVHEVALDLVAEVPGTFEGPASSAYPYYDDQDKAWAAGMAVHVSP